MATLTIRKIDDDLKSRLRRRAAANDRSMEEEVRDILRTTVATDAPTKPRIGLGTRLHERAIKVGGFDLDIPPRGPARPLPDFWEE